MKISKDKIWALKEIEALYKEYEENYSASNAFYIAINIIKQLDEPEKVVIPKFVAEQLEYWKRNKMNILWQFFLREIPSSTLSWLESDAGNYDKLLDAEKNGYEVEQKLYRIELPSGHLMYNSSSKKNPSYSYIPKNLAKESFNYTFTKKEIAAIDRRLWPFVKEVSE